MSGQPATETAVQPDGNSSVVEPAVATIEPAEVSPKPPKKYGFWKRVAYQKLDGWRPILDARQAEIFFLAAGTLCIALGIPILIAALNIKQYSARYDNAGPMALPSREAQQQILYDNGGNGIAYNVEINVEETMKPPIWVVFSLGDFQQNYRRYVRSYDPAQLHDGTPLGIDACLPFLYEGGSANSSLPNDGAVLPCGQIAHSNFNDTFFLSLGQQSLAIDDSNIAWDSDSKHLYGTLQAVNYNANPDYRGGNTTNLPIDEDQHWMVWMRPGGKVPLEKLYGKIDQEIPGGSIVSVSVTNRYNTYGFGGTKTIMLTTNSWVGGKSVFMPSLYIAVGGVCYMLALFFFLGFDAGMWNKRRFGDLDETSWAKREMTGGASIRRPASSTVAPSSSSSH